MDWISYCTDTKFLTTEEEIHLTGSLLFRHQEGSRVLRLAIGAPSSPVVSNILMRNFDEQVFRLVSRDKVIYTRHADDLTFSAPRTGHLTGVQKAVASVIRKLPFPKLDINKDKTSYSTMKYGRTVTGLTLSNDSKITIGRIRKRTIRAGVHRASLGLLSADEIKSRAGMLAFVNATEPLFLSALEAKYGRAVMELIRVASSRTD